ncbi:MAG: ATP-dependent DNA helicase RecG [Microbacteriaceae bacterium]|nr:ATP-dependent DNA helicase RecG [Microbacteriaceae bacterium]
MTDPLDAKLSGVVGGKTAASLEKAFGLVTVGDLLAHYPRRYAQRGELTAIADVPLDENVTIVAEVLDVRTRPMRQRKGSILEVRITDGRSPRAMTLTFFNQAWREKNLRPGVRGIFAGKVGVYRGSLQLAHPDYELFDTGVDAGEQSDADAAKWALTPIPLYPATSTVASWQIARTMQLVLPFAAEVSDPVPAAVRTERGLMPLAESLVKVHEPQVDADWKAAHESLRFTEAFILQAALLQQRAALRERVAQARPRVAGGFVDQLDAHLPFTLTPDQLAVGADIEHDLASSVPMNRLVQGEVGSGKTLVALRAMLQVVDNGGQAVLLAPTEVLASQHLRSIASSLGPDLTAQLMPTLLTGQLPVAAKRAALLRVVSGQARIVVGTHALLSDKTEFFDLGLIVVDEQHRFGVEQRAALQVKAAKTPHSLVLTATPIPRTVAMTVFGDLDVSTITHVPAGRPGITSHAVALDEHPTWINRVWERVGEEIAQGRQAFVVCPAIDASEVEEDSAMLELDLDEPVHADADVTEMAPPERASVAAVTALLRAHPVLGGKRIESLHGRMSADEKDRVMRAFAAGEIDIVVATTVIEVGVDVPNASTMVVMDADRFGVSQLHQLRGRVGRGSVPGLALFVTHAVEGSLARQRVDAVAATTDGFELSRVDLELRAEGDVLGSSQSGGRSSLRLLRAARDGDVIAHARAAAETILTADPALAEHEALKFALRRRLSASEREYLNKG